MRIKPRNRCGIRLTISILIYTLAVNGNLPNNHKSGPLIQEELLLFTFEFCSLGITPGCNIWMKIGTVSVKRWLKIHKLSTSHIWIYQQVCGISRNHCLICHYSERSSDADAFWRNSTSASLRQNYKAQSTVHWDALHNQCYDW